MVEAASSGSTIRRSRPRSRPGPEDRARLVDRVRMVFQVPCWSSLAKMSPATMAVSSGSTHWVANPRTSSARANPLSVANRPNSVSLGGRDWPWMT